MFERGWATTSAVLDVLWEAELAVLLADTGHTHCDPDDTSGVDRLAARVGELERALARTRALLRAADVDRDEARDALQSAQARLATAQRDIDTANARARANRREVDQARAERARAAGERDLARADLAAAVTQSGGTSVEPSGVADGLDATPGAGLATTVAAIVGDLGLHPGSGPAASVGCLDGLADDQVVSVVGAARRMAAWAGAAQAAAAGALRQRWAATPLAGNDDALWITACEIAAAIGLTRHAAAALLHTADHLPARMPRLWTALAEGRLDQVTATMVTEKTQGLPAAVATAVETGLIDALEQSPPPTRPQLVTLTDRLIAAASPETAEENARECRARRGVTFRALTLGMGQMTLISGAEQIEVVRAALNELTFRARQASRPDEDGSEPATRFRGRPDDPDNPRSPCDADGRHPNATRADALVDLITNAVQPTATDPAVHAGHDPNPSDAAASATPSPTPDPTARRADPARACTAQIIVLVPLSVLTGQSQAPATLAGYGPIPAQLARELAVDGTWRCAAIDDRATPDGNRTPTHGTLLGLGRATYTPAYSPGPGLRRFIEIRDGTCQFPGCRHPATRSELDHRTPWADQEGNRTPGDGAHPGVTCECNLHALCAHHHRLKSAGRLTAHPAPHGGTTWTTPTGRRYTRRPDPLA